MPLSPSFPDWLLKRDPTLAGALTNPLFLAFEGRRVLRPREAFLADVAALAIPGIWALGILYLTTSMAMSRGGGPQLVVVVVLFLCFVAMTIRLNRHRGRQQSGTSEQPVLPLELRRAIERDLPEVMAIDLALLPYSTVMTLHATMLERRRADVFKSAFLSVALAGNFGFATAYTLVSDGRWISFLDCAIFGALVLVIPCFAKAIYWSLAGHAFLWSWGALEVSKPPGVKLYPRPAFADSIGTYISLLSFLPFMSIQCAPLIARATAGPKLIVIAFLVASAFTCHRVAGKWRQQLADGMTKMQIVHPENLADILLDTDSEADRAFY
jgi:hypothetical protein